MLSGCSGEPILSRSIHSSMSRNPSSSPRVGRSVGNWTRLAKLAQKFVVDAQFRSKTLYFIQNQMSTDGSTVVRAATGWESPDFLAGYRVYLVGGCELTYVKEWLEERGCATFHTFDHHRSSDPFSEIGDPDSPLWSFDPDAVVLSPVQGSARLFDHLQADGLSLTPDEQQAGLGAAVAGLDAAVVGIRSALTVPVILMSQLLVHRPAFGVLEQSVLGDTLCLAEMKRHYDLEVYDVARRHASTYVLDVDVALSGEGLDETLRGAGELLGVHFTRRGGTLVAERLGNILWALNGSSRRVKCAVFDLDDTLWSGVLREDGIDGVFVNHSALGAMRQFANRGILLALCSKNDPAEAHLVAQLLGDSLNSLLVSTSLSWDPKSQRLKELAADLNIGLDSFALFDDNPRERAEVEMNAPEVLVLTDAQILEALSMPEFEPGPLLTAEAAKRPDMYRTRAERTRSEQAAANPDEFSRSLGLQARLHRARVDEVARVSELIQRTNQMNATLQRSSLAELQEVALQVDGGGIVVAHLYDRFGDYGLVGAVVMRREGSSLRLTELALSCRAMGRKVEHAMIAAVAEGAKADGIEHLLVDFRATERNGQLRSILDEIGFASEHPATGDDVIPLRFAVEQSVPVPDWLAVTMDDDQDGTVSLA